MGRRDVLSEGSAPTLLTGYGGFGRHSTPTYGPMGMAWMQMGGLHAVAIIRGGGELGERWHQDGSRENKPNGFTDFLAVAAWLKASGIATTLGTAGGSNGGLLVAACMLRSPELFEAALPDVGVLDMMRYERLGVGWQWRSEYGSPDDPSMFPVLFGYSPYHAAQEPGSFPPTFITTGRNDDRVVPAHSYKLAAALQASQQGTAPIFLRADADAGHGAGKSREKRAAEIASRLAFLARALGLRLNAEPEAAEPVVKGFEGEAAEVNAGVDAGMDADRQPRPASQRVRSMRHITSVSATAPPRNHSGPISQRASGIAT
jgi:prolyl oligopeptidase